ncbi:cytochrome c oxidase subunit II [Deminuibacter soli]|uniref:Cytochrome c oxidase subunit 2 n=1 Tax=Deminuibacter soli TaxID=2291815 RepID=A0A3E1NR15_9BACT|nr:cytochrome c oxidase subunit II [Deminuibacter soli]RFM30376.1 cytochrome c oxidase subunit II [Deminuibacter soli]
MSMFFTIAVIVLVFLVIFQIAKASEYVSVLKGEEKSRAQANKLNGFFMIAFLVLGLIGVYWCNKLLFHKTLLAREASSIQGERVDSMLWVTLIITGVVFFLTQIALFAFAYKFQENPKRKAFYFPHNNTMELIWTVVPAITLTILVVIGLRNWFFFTSEAPQNALHIEVTGKQFGWIFRYPGHDNNFGKKYFRVIDAASNPLGLIWQDNAGLKLKDDPATHDDIVTEQTVYVVKNRPVQFIINSRDVIHDVGLPEFRMKMDAVPGTPTTMWFTPKFTTKEMKERTGNPDFQYEISCDQMCGNGHYSMKGVVEVVTQEEYDLWLAKQKPSYLSAFPPAEAKPAAAAAPAADSAKTAKATGAAATDKTKI